MKRAGFVVSLLFVFTYSLFAQTDEAAWILFQKAEQFYRNRDYGQALEYYGEALAAQPALPEAQVGMARVYRSEADFVLAERFYLLALKNAGQLAVPEDEYATRLELADMYQVWDRPDRYKAQLEQIVLQDPVFSFPEFRWQKDAMVSLLFERGFDRVVVLYRLDFPQATEAHRRLGEVYLSTGEHQQAIEHLLFSAVEQGGRIINALIDCRFDFQFTVLSDLFAVVENYAVIAEYLQNSGLIETLDVLALALERSQLPDSRKRADEIRSSLQF